MKVQDYKIRLIETVTVTEKGSDWKVRRITKEDGTVLFKKKNLNSFNAFSFERINNQKEISEYERIFDRFDS